MQTLTEVFNDLYSGDGGVFGSAEGARLRRDMQKCGGWRGLFYCYDDEQWNQTSIRQKWSIIERLKKLFNCSFLDLLWAYAEDVVRHRPTAGDLCAIQPTIRCYAMHAPEALDVLLTCRHPSFDDICHQPEDPKPLWTIRNLNLLHKKRPKRSLAEVRWPEHPDDEDDTEGVFAYSLGDAKEAGRKIQVGKRTYCRTVNALKKVGGWSGLFEFGSPNWGKVSLRKKWATIEHLMELLDYTFAELVWGWVAFCIIVSDQHRLLSLYFSIDCYAEQHDEAKEFLLAVRHPGLRAGTCSLEFIWDQLKLLPKQHYEGLMQMYRELERMTENKDTFRQLLSMGRAWRDGK